jgi:hypothetical protein
MVFRPKTAHGQNLFRPKKWEMGWEWVLNGFLMGIMGFRWVFDGLSIYHMGLMGW